MHDKATPPGTAWHTLTAEQVERQLATDVRRGLTTAQAREGLARHGPNSIPDRGERGWLAMLMAQLGDVMVLMLIGAAVIAGALGDLKDMAVILAIVVLNAAIGVAQESRAQRALSELNRLAASAATVLRDGARHGIQAADLVPGDVVLIAAGDIVPADLRLAEAAGLQVNEAALTGESLPVEKQADLMSTADVPLGDRRNLAFKGTTATAGRGCGIVIATGLATELGRIANLLAETVPPPTPLQRRMTALSRRLALVVLLVAVLVLLLGVLRGEPLLTMLLTALSLAVAAIPEALPATLTVGLALGARRMAAQNALVRRLPAVETLGSVTVICSDKTGTLTRNEMAVETLEPAGAMDRLLFAMALNNDADGESGDPTELALIRAAEREGCARRAAAGKYPRIGELPFDSDRKRMTTLHQAEGEVIGYIKGAPEAVLDRCTGSDCEAWRARAQAMAAEGLRVLAFAERRWAAPPDLADAEAIERDLAPIGLVGMHDPPRPEAAEAVAACRSAGIVVVMITGDHPATAQAIARRLGILEEGQEVMTGAELARLDDDALDQRIDAARVFARVDPAQKIRIVAALQQRGNFVAMTGDGVNDAPALQRADIGVAMGKSGTDVAREAASLVLLDDNFATIVAAVREGRRIYDNLRKLVCFLLTGNSAEILTILLPPLLGLPVPLLPIHILWINLVTDGLPAVALAFERAERDIMRRPPRPTRDSVFAGGMGWRILGLGAFTSVVSLAAQLYAEAFDRGLAQTMVFTVLTLAQMSLVLSMRAERQSLLSHGVLTNRWLIGAVLLVVAVQLAIVYLPAGNAVFGTVPLGGTELAACFGLAVLVFAAAEVEKWLRRRLRP